MAQRCLYQLTSDPFFFLSAPVGQKKTNRRSTLLVFPTWISPDLSNSLTHPDHQLMEQVYTR